MTRRGEAWRAEGHFREAADDLSAALAIAGIQGDQYLLAASKGALGDLALASRRTATAEPLLLASFATARRLNDAPMMGTSSNDLGNLYAATARPALASRPMRMAFVTPKRPVTRVSRQSPKRIPAGLP